MGDDFSYFNAAANYASMDLLIEHFNAKYDDVQLAYSNPELFIDAINE